MTDLFDPAAPHDSVRILALYEWLRERRGGRLGSESPAMRPRLRPPHHAPRLRDLLGEFDALLLDGYGVLNVGDAMVDGADKMLNEAEAAGVSVVVVTNGASKKSTAVAGRYRNLGLHLGNEQVVSSRNALERRLGQTPPPYRHIGVVDTWATPPHIPGVMATPLSPQNPAAWHGVEALCFLGARRWDECWQECLMEAAAGGIPLLVANPDMAAPQGDAPKGDGLKGDAFKGGGFSKEPGYWAAMAQHRLGDALALEWYGKPHQAVFDLALETLARNTGRDDWNKGRIAMVGDTLHTDIEGGQAAGLKTILIIGHGMFRDGGAAETIAATGIIPDFIVDTV